MKLMVLFMHQLQLIGIKTNLESFVTTTLMEQMLNRHQLHLFLWVSKQWGYYVESQNPTDYRYWSIPFTSHYITMATKTYYEPKEEAVPWLVGIDMQKFICGYGANFIGSSYVSCVGIGC